MSLENIQQRLRKNAVLAVCLALLCGHVAASCVEDNTNFDRVARQLGDPAKFWKLDEGLRYYGGSWDGLPKFFEEGLPAPTGAGTCVRTYTTNSSVNIEQVLLGQAEFLEELSQQAPTPSLETNSLFQEATISISITKTSIDSCKKGGRSDVAYIVSSYQVVYRQAGRYDDGSAGELELNLNLNQAAVNTRHICAFAMDDDTTLPSLALFFAVDPTLSVELSLVSAIVPYQHFNLASPVPARRESPVLPNTFSTTLRNHMISLQDEVAKACGGSDGNFSEPISTLQTVLGALGNDFVEDALLLWQNFQDYGNISEGWLPENVSTDAEVRLALGISLFGNIPSNTVFEEEEAGRILRPSGLTWNDVLRLAAGRILLQSGVAWKRSTLQWTASPSAICSDMIELILEDGFPDNDIEAMFWSPFWDMFKESPEYESDSGAQKLRMSHGGLCTAEVGHMALLRAESILPVISHSFTALSTDGEALLEGDCILSSAESWEDYILIASNASTYWILRDGKHSLTILRDDSRLCDTGAIDFREAAPILNSPIPGISSNLFELFATKYGNEFLSPKNPTKGLPREYVCQGEDMLELRSLYSIVNRPYRLLCDSSQCLSILMTDLTFSVQPDLNDIAEVVHPLKWSKRSLSVPMHTYIQSVAIHQGNQWSTWPSESKLLSVPAWSLRASLTIPVRWGVMHGDLLPWSYFALGGSQLNPTILALLIPSLELVPGQIQCPGAVFGSLSSDPVLSPRKRAAPNALTVPCSQFAGIGSIQLDYIVKALIAEAADMDDGEFEEADLMTRIPFTEITLPNSYDAHEKIKARLDVEYPFLDPLERTERGLNLTFDVHGPMCVIVGSNAGEFRCPLGCDPDVTSTFSDTLDCPWLTEVEGDSHSILLISEVLIADVATAYIFNAAETSVSTRHITAASTEAFPNLDAFADYFTNAVGVTPTFSVEDIMFHINVPSFKLHSEKAKFKTVPTFFQKGLIDRKDGKLIDKEGVRVELKLSEPVSERAMSFESLQWAAFGGYLPKLYFATFILPNNRDTSQSCTVDMEIDGIIMAPFTMDYGAVSSGGQTFLDGKVNVSLGIVNHPLPDLTTTFATRVVNITVENCVSFVAKIDKSQCKWFGENTLSYEFYESTLPEVESAVIEMQFSAKSYAGVAARLGFFLDTVEENDGASEASWDFVVQYSFKNIESSMPSVNVLLGSFLLDANSFFFPPTPNEFYQWNLVYSHADPSKAGISLDMAVTSMKFEQLQTISELEGIWWLIFPHADVDSFLVTTSFVRALKALRDSIFSLDPFAVDDGAGLFSDPSLQHDMVFLPSQGSLLDIISDLGIDGRVRRFLETLVDSTRGNENQIIPPSLKVFVNAITELLTNDADGVEPPNSEEVIEEVTEVFDEEAEIAAEGAKKKCSNPFSVKNIDPSIIFTVLEAIESAFDFYSQFCSTFCPDMEKDTHIQIIDNQLGGFEFLPNDITFLSEKSDFCDDVCNSCFKPSLPSVHLELIPALSGTPLEVGSVIEMKANISNPSKDILRDFTFNVIHDDDNMTKVEAECFNRNGTRVAFGLTPLSLTEETHLLLGNRSFYCTWEVKVTQEHVDNGFVRIGANVSCASTSVSAIDSGLQVLSLPVAQRPIRVKLMTSELIRESSSNGFYPVEKDRVNIFISVLNVHGSEFELITPFHNLNIANYSLLEIDNNASIPCQSSQQGSQDIDLGPTKGVNATYTLAIDEEILCLYTFVFDKYAEEEEQNKSEELSVWLDVTGALNISLQAGNQSATVRYDGLQVSQNAGIKICNGHYLKNVLYYFRWPCDGRIPLLSCSSIFDLINVQLNLPKGRFNSTGDKATEMFKKDSDKWKGWITILSNPMFCVSPEFEYPGSFAAFKSKLCAGLKFGFDIGYRFGHNFGVWLSQGSGIILKVGATARVGRNGTFGALPIDGFQASLGAAPPQIPSFPKEEDRGNPLSWIDHIKFVIWLKEVFIDQKVGTTGIQIVTQRPLPLNQILSLHSSMAVHVSGALYISCILDIAETKINLAVPVPINAGLVVDGLELLRKLASKLVFMKVNGQGKCVYDFPEKTYKLLCTVPPCYNRQLGDDPAGTHTPECDACCAGYLPLCDEFSMSTPFGDFCRQTCGLRGQCKPYSSSVRLKIPRLRFAAGRLHQGVAHPAQSSAIWRKEGNPSNCDLLFPPGYKSYKNFGCPMEPTEIAKTCMMQPEDFYRPTDKPYFELGNRKHCTREPVEWKSAKEESFTSLVEKTEVGLKCASCGQVWPCFVGVCINFLNVPQRQYEIRLMNGARGYNSTFDKDFKDSLSTYLSRFGNSF